MTVYLPSHAPWRSQLPLANGSHTPALTNKQYEHKEWKMCLRLQLLFDFQVPGLLELANCMLV